MYKKWHEITLRDYVRMEETGRINKLCSYPILFIFFRKNVKKQLDKAIKLLNTNESNDEKEDLIWQTMTLAKINAIESSYLAILNLLKIGSKVSILTSLMRRKDKRRIKFTNKNLETHIKYIKNYTGIEIKDLNDIEKVRRELKFRKDKYNENNAKRTQKQTKKRYLMSVILGVFSYLNQTINMEMTIVEFKRIWDDFNEKVERDKINANARS